MAKLSPQFEQLLLEVLPEKIEPMMFADGIIRPSDINRSKRDRIRSFFDGHAVVPKRFIDSEPINLRGQIMQGGFGVIKEPQIMISGNIGILKELIEAEAQNV